MTEKDAMDLIEILYPYFIKKYKEDNSYKSTAMVTNAIVKSVDNGVAVIQVNPYDKTNINAVINSGLSIDANDSVLVMYYDSLKNARIIAKN